MCKMILIKENEYIDVNVHHAKESKAVVVSANVCTVEDCDGYQTKSTLLFSNNYQRHTVPMLRKNQKVIDSIREKVYSIPDDKLKLYFEVGDFKQLISEVLNGEKIMGI